MTTNSFTRTVFYGLIAVLIPTLAFLHLASAFGAGSDQPLAIMVEGNLYLIYYRQDGDIPADVEIAGHIISCVDLSDLPAQNDQANFPSALNQPYAWVDGELYLCLDDQWYLCEPKA